MSSETTESPPQGFARLYSERYDAMVRLAYLLTDDNAVAEELVQDAFVRLYRQWDRLDNPPAYLRTAVVNACRSHHRRRYVARRHAPEPPGVVQPHELDGMWELLGQLSDKRRTALVLRFYEDLSIADIAVAMGCRPGTVKSLLHRGLAQLKEMVEL